MSFEKAHSEIKILVENFKPNENFYISKEYQEAEVRKDFIDKFFIALGWDVLHHTQTNPYEQEVKVEKGVNVSGAQKKADYSFSLAPNYRDPKFFTEAKKPSKDLYNSDYYFQTVRYGWHKTTPLAVLTDFEEFHILDCRFSPDISTILHRKIKQYHYSEYVDSDKFAEIYWLFSREAVINNSLEKFAENLPKPKGKAYQKALFAYEKHLTIDDAFLEEIDGIREILAKAFKKNDDKLDSEELTEATQRTIDRLVFIRFLEDKLIEQVHYVNTFGENGKAWDDFIALCIKLDAKYNGIVFKKCFIDDSNFKGPVDSEFHDICQNICHLNSRFLYNEIPIHILGSIYERFLGKVVHATNKRVTVEEKPEVRKAGGVFYTPKNIVNYIVQNTVGKQIEGKDPEQISKLRFADIACGSGSFLIGVLEYLLDYYNKYYQQHPEKAKKDKCLYKDGIWVLSIKQKQNILKNNIYGVDIDNQAVEVTQLSLSLKMLEDETTATANEMQVLFHERILPDMSNNIICGNSLIGTDILTQTLFAGEEERKLNPMDFSHVFPKIMESGGFDSIIGNPPYVFTRDVNWPDSIKQYYWDNFNIAKEDTSRKNQSGKINLYILFILRASRLISKNGTLSYIIPNGLLRTTTYDTTRKYILKNTSIYEIVDLKDGVFKGVTASTIILTLKKFKENNKVKIIDSNYKLDKSINTTNCTTVNQKDFLENTSYVISMFVNNEERGLFTKLNKSNFYLQNIVIDIIEGIVAHKEFISSSKLDDNYFPLLEGKDIKPYQINFGGNYILYDRKKLHRARPEYVWNSDQKIIIQRISGGAKPLVAAIDFNKRYSFASTNLLLIKKEFLKVYNYNIVCAILNSALINFYYSKNFTNASKLTVNISKTFLDKIPLPIFNFSNNIEKTNHNKLTKLVDLLNKTINQISSSKTDKDLTYYNRRYNDLISQIDITIFEIYGLTEDEINIVVNSGQ